MNEKHLLEELLPYRMRAVDILNLALKLQANYGRAPMEIYANNKAVIVGNLTAFTNPAIEAGLTHCRALLEFLGLCATNDGHLGNVPKRRRTDIGIEKFSNATGPLPMVKPSQVLAGYGGSPDEAEKALLTIFHITNKGIAHVTEDFREHPEHADLVEIASRGVPSLVVSYLYTPLNLPAPNYKVPTRPRKPKAGS
jgi:hypothetical protein